MRSGLFAEDFAARTDSGTSDSLHSTSDCPPGGAGSRSSRRRAPLNTKVGLDYLYMSAIDSRGLHVNVGSGLELDFARLEFP